MDVDRQALNAAEVHAKGAHGSCKHCDSWNHVTEVCPFMLEEEMEDFNDSHMKPPPKSRAKLERNGKVIDNPPSRSGTNTDQRRERPRGCIFYNSRSGCKKGSSCDWPHVCAFCGSDAHMVKYCSSAPVQMKL